MIKGGNLLYKVENCNPIAYGREETGSIRAEQQVPLAVNSPQEVRELVAVLVPALIYTRKPSNVP